jgi:molybdenum cofactor cytidylyltransferase
LPTYRGKQGNPMIWAARFVPQMQAIGGDVGARHLLGANLDLAHEVEMTSDAVLRDFDTAESLKGA